MMTALDTIIIKAHPGTKARWVRQSQALGQKLSDWVCTRVDRAPDADPMPWVSRWTAPPGAVVVVMTEAQVRDLLSTAYIAGACGAK
jgi:hypothetical protein